MDQKPSPSYRVPEGRRLPDTPEYRALRKRIALALFLLPMACVLPLLSLMASTTDVRWIIWGISLVLGLVLMAAMFRAALAIRRLAEAEAARQEQEERG